MEPRKHTIPVKFVDAALRGARRQAVDIDAVLQSAGIAPDLLAAASARVSTEQYTALMQALWQQMADEFVGFCPHGRCKMGTFAMMCYTAIHCGTLKRALSRGMRFYGLVTEAFSIALTQDDQEATITFTNHQLDDPDHFLTECWLVIWHGLACWLTGRRIQLTHASFTYPEPGHIDEYRRMFYARSMQFNAATTSIRFPVNALSLPIIQNEVTLKQFLKTSPADLLVRPKNDDSLNGQIRAMLRKLHDYPEFEHIAAQLNMTPQTLRRRLKEEGTSYQQIKDNLRRDAAIYYLSRPEIGLDDIATELGFSEPSAFHRAFKKWTGVTPGIYRQEHVK
ncbi:AraC family transcriptional regulator [Chitinivorax sp. B]|uniref:AraC family transcriptional regulator n=1 Tax=Chitinivorax sp. B TaxID=2502235 RepID=UPI0010F4CE9A|nr:AraC family transcriptional regulator [Chitinivorax sp. B]